METVSIIWILFSIQMETVSIIWILYPIQMETVSIIWILFSIQMENVSIIWILNPIQMETVSIIWILYPIVSRLFPKIGNGFQRSWILFPKMETFGNTSLRREVSKMDKCVSFNRRIMLCLKSSGGCLARSSSGGGGFEWARLFFVAVWRSWRVDLTGERGGGVAGWCWRFAVGLPEWFIWLQGGELFRFVCGAVWMLCGTKNRRCCWVRCEIIPNPSTLRCTTREGDVLWRSPFCPTRPPKHRVGSRLQQPGSVR